MDILHTTDTTPCSSPRWSRSYLTRCHVHRAPCATEHPKHAQHCARPVAPLLSPPCATPRRHGRAPCTAPLPSMCNAALPTAHRLRAPCIRVCTRLPRSPVQGHTLTRESLAVRWRGGRARPFWSTAGGGVLIYWILLLRLGVSSR
jgi:hypothetical protein